MAEIIRADTAGFCMGVDLALQKLNRVVQEESDGGPIRTFGPIIHNPHVLKEYAALGVHPVEQPEEIQPNSRVVVRAHGIPKQIQEALESRGASLVDATCPKVKKAQRLIQDMSSKGHHLLLFGEREHPEVAGLLSYADSKAKVFESLQELQSLELQTGESYFLAAQTTQDRREFNAIVEAVRKRLFSDIPVFDTICDTTRQRQQEAVDIAGRVDIMVVVGGYESGNTRRLAQVVSTQGTPSLHIERAEELPASLFEGVQRVGLTAGASTPSQVIQEVEEALHRLFQRA